MNVLREEILHWAPISAPVPEAIHYKKMVTPVLVSERTLDLILVLLLIICMSGLDRCAEGSHKCEQVCHNTGAGSYTCSCHRGYKLADNGHSCEGIVGNTLPLNILVLHTQQYMYQLIVMFSK